MIQKKIGWSWLSGILFIVLLGALWVPISQIGANPAVIRAWLEPWGPLAPVGFFLLNVIQIVVAPIPGYPIQVLGGILFGFVLGAIYTVAGMTTGGVLAAWLTRRLGRPWLERRLGPEMLAQWGDLTHINSFWTWWLLLLIPVGDLPYFFAGLTKIRLRTLVLAIVTSRGPFTVLLVWTGSSVADLPLSWLAALAVIIGLVVVIGFNQRSRIEAWARTIVTREAKLRQAGDNAETNHEIDEI